MRWWWVFIIIGIAGGGWLVLNSQPILSPKANVVRIKENFLTRYDFDSLRKRGGKASEIEMLGSIKEVDERRGRIKSAPISFLSREIRFVSEGKKISGMLNTPKDIIEPKKYPVIIMVRGYADKEGYYPGSGTWKAADRLAENGFVTVSLDFLGFAHSDSESLDMMEARFEKVPAVLDLIASVKRLPYVDENRIGIWAHSNGGQIALSVLEILPEKIPTVLWAPMTNPFPKSILDQASELDDGGKAVIMAVEKFEKKYDSRRYAFENYLERVNSPVLIHQGTKDPWCKVPWQRDLVQRMVLLGKKAKLDIVEGDDHNFSKSWEDTMGSDIKFFGQELF